MQNREHETTEFLELFLRKLLLNEKNELHNRAMHISGAYKKQDIQGEKQDIEVPFPYEDVLKVNGFKAKSLNHAEKLYKEFGKETIFGRSDVSALLGITPSPAPTLLKRLLEVGAIVPISGVGKGKYRFKL